jgi:N-acetyl sugar amidotransferase
MPNTRPGITFNEKGTCSGCQSYEKQSFVDWKSRLEELKTLCNKYRGSNGNSYDCAIAVSGGKDSHFQVYWIKEIMKMNPVLLAVGNVDWTETGKRNLENLSETFKCDIIQLHPNRELNRRLTVHTFKTIGKPGWYVDALIYAFPYRMAIKLGIKLLVYGENVNYIYGGVQIEDTPSARLQSFNDVVKPIHQKLIDDNIVTRVELNSAIPPSVEECDYAGLEPIYLSYFVPWDSHHSFEVAKRWGFEELMHEYVREGTLESYNQIDSLGYLIDQHVKYAKFGHASATEMASRWIRAGRISRDMGISLVNKYDKNLDQGIINNYCNFTGLSKRELFDILDTWYNKDLFWQDEYRIWHPKFVVGQINEKG